MEIRVMNKADIPEVLEIEHLSFSTPWTEGMFASELNNPKCRYFTAVERDSILGFAGVFMVLDEGYINNIAVAPQARCRGVGSLLMSTLIEYARSIELSFLTLEVRETNNSAISLYSSLGFIEVGKRRGYYEHPKEDAVLMTYRINPEKA